MAKYRKKPVVIEAILCSEAMRCFREDWLGLPSWLERAYSKGGVVATDQGIYLPTLEGSMLANPDDMIICGVKGEVYPCKPDIFEATYEPINESCVGSFITDYPLREGEAPSSAHNRETAEAVSAPATILHPTTSNQGENHD